MGSRGVVFGFHLGAFVIRFTGAGWRLFRLSSLSLSVSTPRGGNVEVSQRIPEGCEA